MYSSVKYKEENKYTYDFYENHRPIKLTKSWERGFNAAKTALKDSDGTRSRDRMGSSIFCGSTLLAIGANQYGKTNTGNIIRNKKGKIFIMGIHAEQAALTKIKYREYENKKLVCYVVRISNAGEFLTSKPCEMCLTNLQEKGIKTVRFINSSGIPCEIFL